MLTFQRLMLEKIDFENYRCFKKSSINFKKTAIIVGKNNAGKSTVVEALRIIANAGKKSKTAIYSFPPKSMDIPHQMGFSLDPHKLKIDLRSVVYFYDASPFAKIVATFEEGTKITVYLTPEGMHAVIFDKDDTIISRKSQVLGLTIDTVSILPQIGLIKENEKKLNEETIKADKDTYLSSRHFRNELLQFKDEYYNDFKSIAEETWPKLRIRELAFFPGKDDFISLLVEDEGFTAEIGLMGSGIQMWLQIIWFMARCKGSEAIILDEPDVYMHPDMQRKILDIALKKYKQVIIATHSVEIMSAVDAKNIVTINKKIKRMQYANDSKAVQKIIDDLGSVHNINLVRLAISKKCLFVEGEDIKILSKLKEKLNTPSEQPLDTLPCFSLEGASNLKKAFGVAELLFEETEGEMSCHCILDRDYQSDDSIEKHMKEAQESHLVLHVWKKKEIENYLLIPAAIFRITKNPIGGYDTFCKKLDQLLETQKEETILQLASQLEIQDRKKKDLKSYIKLATERVNMCWNTLDNKLGIVSGKQMIGLINEWMEKEYHAHCSQSIIISNIKANEIDEEMVILLKEISK